MMRRMFIPLAAMVLAVPLAAQVAGQDTAPVAEVQYGPVFADFGPHYAIEGIAEVPSDIRFAHSFDVATRAEGDARNRGFESAARFVNMHAAHGVAKDAIRVAVVVHGSAVLDLLSDAARAARNDTATGTDNPSAAMVRAMLDEGVRFIVCGQSAVGSGVAQGDLIEGVEMALSAMTAHALLQQAGYTVNPF